MCQFNCKNATNMKQLGNSICRYFFEIDHRPVRMSSTNIILTNYNGGRFLLHIVFSQHLDGHESSYDRRGYGEGHWTTSAV